MNKIRLSFKDMQEILILPEKDELIKIWNHINDNGFIFNDFVLVVEPLQQVCKVHIEGSGSNQIFHIKMIKTGLNGLTTTKNHSITCEDFLQRYADLMYDMVNKKHYKELIKNDTIDFLMPLHFMQYVIHSELNRTIEYIEPIERSGHSKPYKRITNNTHEYSLTDCIRIYHSKNKNRKKYEITCESWNVRGFFRHNKNGTVTWVKPFKKGKNRNDNDDKNYRI